MLRIANWPWCGWHCVPAPRRRFPRPGFAYRESGGRDTGTTGRRVRTPPDQANCRALECSAIQSARPAAWLRRPERLRRVMRCKHHEEVGGAVALVLVIATGRTSRLHRDRQARFGEQL